VNRRVQEHMLGTLVSKSCLKKIVKVADVEAQVKKAKKDFLSGKRIVPPAHRPRPPNRGHGLAA